MHTICYSLDNIAMLSMSVIYPANVTSLNCRVILVPAATPALVYVSKANILFPISYVTQTPPDLWFSLNLHIPLPKVNSLGNSITMYAYVGSAALHEKDNVQF